MKICFFSTDAKLAKFQQYLLQDIEILRDLGFDVHVTSSILELIMPRYDLYFSWWATGSSLSVLISKIYGKKSIAILGGNECVHYKDSVSGISLGYLNYSWIKKIAVKYTLINANLIVAVSNFMVDHVKKISGRVPLVCYNTVDESIFNQSKIECASNKSRYIMTIANFEKIPYHVKRVDNLLVSFSMIIQKFPDLKLLILGRRGDAYEYFLNKACLLNVSSHIIDFGMVENSRVPELMKNSSAYIQISDTETFGQSVVEALSCGIPIVVSSSGALPEVCGDLGTYVDHNSPKSISDGLFKVLSMSESDLCNFRIKAENHVKMHFVRAIRKDFFKKNLLTIGLN